MITKEQHRMLRHSLGILENQNEYRNHYAAEKDDADCNELVSLGWMYKGKEIEGGLKYFHVTPQGKVLAHNEWEVG